MTTINLDLNPFPVPNSVSAKLPPGKKQDGFKIAPTIPLGELDDNTLHEMCDEFRTAIFARAYKQRDG